METGKYAVPGTGSYGNMLAGRWTAEYHHDRMGRNGLQFCGDGFNIC